MGCHFKSITKDQLYLLKVSDMSFVVGLPIKEAMYMIFFSKYMLMIFQLQKLFFFKLLVILQGILLGKPQRGKETVLRLAIHFFKTLKKK